jgi:hypothetical protein
LPIFPGAASSNGPDAKRFDAESERARRERARERGREGERERESEGGREGGREALQV